MQVYLVGGAVRDKLLGRPVKDRDFVIVGASVEQMLAAGFVQVGADFPVFLHPTSHEEYALARTERKQGHGYKGFRVYASPDVSLQDDLQRRDLTINAMAIEVVSLTDTTPITGEVIDYYGGLDDIERRSLRHVSEAFSEDPLRVLRVARFYGRYHDLGFTIANETLKLMRQLVASGELAHLSSERVWQESSRATMQATPHVYWQLLYEIGALTEYFTPLAQAWSHTIIRETVQTALYFSGQMQLNLSQRWALLMSSMDKSLFQVLPTNTHTLETIITEDSVYKNVAPEKQISEIAKQVRTPKAQTQFATLFVQQAQHLTHIDQLSAAQKIDLIQACSAHKTPEKLSQLLVVSQVLKLSSDHRHMMLALSSFHAIDITNIAPDIKGAAIGHALRDARIDYLQAQDKQA